ISLFRKFWRSWQTKRASSLLRTPFCGAEQNCASSRLPFVGKETPRATYFCGFEGAVELLLDSGVISALVASLYLSSVSAGRSFFLPVSTFVFVIPPPPR